MIYQCTISRSFHFWGFQNDPSTANHLFSVCVIFFAKFSKIRKKFSSRWGTKFFSKMYPQDLGILQKCFFRVHLKKYCKIKKIKPFITKSLHKILWVICRVKIYGTKKIVSFFVLCQNFEGQKDNKGQGQGRPLQSTGEKILRLYYTPVDSRETFFI